MGQLTLESLVCMVLSCLEWPETVIGGKFTVLFVPKNMTLSGNAGKKYFCFGKMWHTFSLKSPLVISIFLTVDVYSPKCFQLFITQYGTNKDDMLKNPEILFCHYHFTYSHAPHTVTSLY